MSAKVTAGLDLAKSSCFQELADGRFLVMADLEHQEGPRLHLCRVSQEIAIGVKPIRSTVKR